MIRVDYILFRLINSIIMYINKQLLLFNSNGTISLSIHKLVMRNSDREIYFQGGNNLEKSFIRKYVKLNPGQDLSIK